MIRVAKDKKLGYTVEAEGNGPQLAMEIATVINSLARNFDNNIAEGAGQVFLDMLAEAMKDVMENDDGEHYSAFMVQDRRNPDGT